MGLYNLNRIIKPQQVAVIGASEKDGSIGNAIMKNLLDGGFQGSVLPVNPHYQTTHRRSCYCSISDLDVGIDLAIIATPIHTVPEIVQECVNHNVAGAIILSAGGRETGQRGKDIEKQIKNITRPSGFRVIGPNCIGIIQPSHNFNATFVTGMPSAGNLGFVSQSGAICSSILDLAAKEHIGFSHFVSLGSMLDVDFADMIDYFGNDSSVQSILLYVEELTNFRKFMSAARSVSRIKPIIVLKAGKSLAGLKAAASHTGAMTGEDNIYDAAFKRAGIVRVDTIEDLFDCAGLMAKQPRPRGPRLAIITNGGGPGVMAADFLSSHGYDPPPIDTETMAKLDEILPPFWSHNNPIDILGDAPASRFQKVLEVCLSIRLFDGVLVILTPQAMTDSMAVAEAICAMLKGRPYPLFACWMGGQSIEMAVELMNASGIPTFNTPERAIKAFLYMVAFSRNQELLSEIPPKCNQDISFDRKKVDTILNRNPQEGFLPESDVRQIFAAYGLPIVETEVAENEDQAVQISNRIGYPVVLKLCSPDITHKTDTDGVCLDLRSDLEVQESYLKIRKSVRQYKQNAQFEGATVQPYLASPDYELILGSKRDPQFGQVILFGMGGIYTEVIGDKAIGLPPMNRLLARRMMQETKVYGLLQGYRNRPPANLDMLEQVILRLSQLVVDFPQISELDMNPVLIKKGQPFVVDGRMAVTTTEGPSLKHLIISPYPEENEYRVVTNSGVHVFIRPIKPEDAPSYITFFRSLSPTTIYFRFFSVLKELPTSMLVRFTQIDYDREIALVAIDEDTAVEHILGVARIIGDPDSEEGEFAVLIADNWQGKGLGASLLKKCLLIAEKRGFKKVHGVVLKENTNMLALGKKLGFKMTKGEDPHEFTLFINFGSPELIKGLGAQ